MSVSSTEHLDKLAFILYDRPAGRNVIGYAIEEIEKLRADLAVQRGCCDGAAAQDAHVRREREEMQSAKADAWDEGYQDHKEMIEGIARKPSNPYR